MSQRKLGENEFRIAEGRMAELVSKFAKLNKKADKLGVVPVSFKIVETETVKVLDKEGTPTGKVKIFTIITVSGDAPKLNGWTFAATLEHHASDDGTSINLLRKVPGFGQDLPHIFRTRGPEHCDHCLTKRLRNDTFVVYNEENDDWKQVGRTCLRDFLGHSSPEAVARYCTYLVSLDLGNEDFWGDERGDKWEPMFSHDEVIARTIVLIDQDGWMSRGQSRNTGVAATADGVWSWLNPPTHPQALRHWEKAFGNLEISEADRAKAQKVIEWSEELGGDDPNDLGDYLFNLRQSFRLAAVGDRQMGIVASAVSTYERAMEKEIKRRQFAKLGENSDHMGQPKDRLDLTVTILSVFDHDGYYGVSHIHKMVTDEGNVVTWFASKERLDVGATYKGKATVKKHGEYKGTKETTVTRCKLAKVEALAS